MHFYLSLGNRGLQRPPENPSDWGGWAYFVYTFLPEHRTFTIDELVQHSSTIFQQETQKTIAENFRLVLRAYTEQQAIAGCQFLTTGELLRILKSYRSAVTALKKGI